MNSQATCTHENQTRSAHAGVTVIVCADCPVLQFLDALGYVSPTVALGRLFGEFDLVGGLDAVRAPGREVLMYRAGDLLTAAALRVIKPNEWFRADHELWICHDGAHLLFAHDHPIVSDMIGA